MTPRIHHYGQIVASIETHLSRSIWRAQSAIVVDPLQGARLVLVSFPGDLSSPWVELVEPLGEGSPVWSALQKGVSWHHVCLAVASRAEAERISAEHRLLAVTPWVPAVLFGGRAVRFVFSRSRELIEFLADEEPA